MTGPGRRMLHAPSRSTLITVDAAESGGIEPPSSTPSGEIASDASASSTVCAGGCPERFALVEASGRLQMIPPLWQKVKKN